MTSEDNNIMFAMVKEDWKDMVIDGAQNRHKLLYICDFYANHVLIKK